MSVAKGDQLRVYVYVDQSSAPSVHAGDAAIVRVPERPGWSRTGTVTRTSGQLSPKTRTMLTEVDIPNADQAIIPGSFVDVTVDVKVPPVLEIPAEALVIRNDKTAVAVVDDTQHIHYQPVVVADDDGQIVHLASGIKAGQTRRAGCRRDRGGWSAGPGGRGEGDGTARDSRDRDRSLTETRTSAICSSARVPGAPQYPHLPARCRPAIRELSGFGGRW